MTNLLRSILVLVICLGLTACSQTPSPLSETSSPSQPEQHSSPYLSITTTTPHGTNLYFTYQLDTKTLQQVAETPDSAQYPLGAIDLKNEVLFYAERDANGSDQLVKLDLKTKQKEALTSELFAINSIIPTGDKVILATAEQEKDVVQLASYDLGTKKLTFWMKPEDNDTSVRSLSYNPFTRKLYATQYSFAEGSKNMEKANETQADDVVAATHRVIEYDLNGTSLREVYKAQEVVPSFSVSKDTALALIRSAPMVHKHRENFLQDLQSGKKEKLDLPELGKIEEICLSFDKQGFYFAGTLQNPPKHLAPVEGALNGLYYYDFASRSITLLFSKPDAYINNFVLLDGPSAALQ